MREMTKVTMSKKAEVDLEIYKIEQVENSWEKRIYLKNISGKIMMWGEGEIEKRRVVNDFYISTTDLLDLSGCSDYYIYSTTSGNSFPIYSNRDIEILFDEENNHFIDAVQKIVVHYLMENQMPPYYFDERKYEGDGEEIRWEIEEGNYSGIKEDETYHNPVMDIEWELEGDILYMRNEILDMEFDITKYEKDPYENIYSEFAKEWNRKIDGYYDWSEGDFSELSEEVYSLINKKLEEEM